MATPITGDTWHLSIDDLLAPIPETLRLGGPGPFVINLSASSAPIRQPIKGVVGYENAHVYQIQRTEDRRLRYRLRLGPFVTEEEAEAILTKVRDIYPCALTATAEADDLRAIASVQAKLDARQPVDKVLARGVVDIASAADKAVNTASTDHSPPVTKIAAAAPQESEIPVLTTVAVAVPRTAAAPAIVQKEGAAPAPAPRPPRATTIAATAPRAPAPPPEGQSAAGARTAPAAGSRVAAALAVPNTPAPAALSTTSAAALPAVKRPATPGVRTLGPQISLAAPGPVSLVAKAAPVVGAPGAVSPAVTSPAVAAAAVAAAAVAPAVVAARAVSSPVIAPAVIAAPRVAAPPVVAPPVVASPAVAAAAVAPAMVATRVAASPVIAPAVIAAPGVAAPPVLASPGVAAAAVAPAMVAARVAASPVIAPAVIAAPRVAAPPVITSPAVAAAVVARVPSLIQGPVEQLNTPLANLEFTQTLRPVTPLELQDTSSARWFAIQLAVSEQFFDPDSLPNLDIFGVYRLYAITGVDQGRVMHALRLGFFSEDLGARAVASYLGAYYENPAVKRVSNAERDRFSDRRVEARKDIGATGRHTSIEITGDRIARRSVATASSNAQLPVQKGR